MHIEFKREGGPAYFPGLSKPRTVDVGALPSEQAEALERSVHDARFFEQPPVVGAASIGAADLTSYTITIQGEGEQRHSVRLIEPVREPHLRALLDRLKQVEKEQRRAERARE